jgi:GT2 family glycosyltransferase
MSHNHSLVFLTYNKPGLIDARLSEIERYMSQRDDFAVHVLDNGSTGKDVRLTLLSRAQTAKYPLTIRIAEHNLGFGPGFNRVLSQVEDSVVHLLSDDVSIFGDLIEAHNSRLPWDASEVRCHRIIKHPAGWNKFGDKIIPYPDGYYLAMHIETWKLLGGFDEQFVPHDYEDVDLGYRIAQSFPLSLVEMPELPIQHRSASTIGYNDARYEQTVKMRALFCKKWNLPNQPERP